MADDFGARQRTYAGPWQIYGRDIDPTLPPPRLLRNEHDESELGPTFTSDDEAWWVTPGPSYGPDDPPVGDGWAVDEGDVPAFEPMVKREEGDRTRWVVLHAYHDWRERTREDEETSARGRREFWSHVYSWLVRPEDRDALVAHLEQRSLMGRWMPWGRRHTDAAYLGELPWAMAAMEEEVDPHREIETGDGVGSKSVKVCATWEEFNWEGNVLDCSMEDGVAARMPDRVLFDAGGLAWVPGTRTWRGPDGKTAAQYRDRDGHHALLVRENWLNADAARLRLFDGVWVARRKAVVRGRIVAPTGWRLDGDKRDCFSSLTADGRSASGAWRDGGLTGNAAGARDLVWFS